MARSQDSFSKKEKEKKKAQQRQEKQEKKDERKANAKKGKSLEDMMAYIDEYGNISSTPPDPNKRIEIKQEDIQIGVPKQAELTEEELIRNGVVSFFNEAKGFGFIRDLQSQESIFVHINQMQERIVEGDKVTFEVVAGPKGYSAVGVKKVK